MIVCNPGNNTDKWVHHIGRIQFSPKAHFNDCNIDLPLGKMKQGAAG